MVRPSVRVRIRQAESRMSGRSSPACARSPALELLRWCSHGEVFQMLGGWSPY